MSDRAADVLVVGGGPAGLAAAIACRLRGLTVRVLDKRRPPIDKPCGEGLMPDGLARLAEWGVSLGAAGCPFSGIRYLDGERVAEGEFPGGAGLGLRRTALHAALVRRAAELEVELDWGARVRGLHPRGLETEDGVIDGRWIVGADGLHSQVRGWTALGAGPGSLRRFGVRRHFAVEPWTDKVEVHWADRCEAYVTPVGRREVGVAMLWSGEKTRFDALLERFPALRPRLAGAAVTSSDRGAGPLDQRVRAVTRGRVALVGDAAGYRDAITGEGMALAFHQAAALAGALAGGDLAPYAAAHRRLAALPFALIRALLLAERRPWLRRRMIATFARDPEIFRRLLAIHARQLPLRGLRLTGTWRLVRGLATPA